MKRAKTRTGPTAIGAGLLTSGLGPARWGGSSPVGELGFAHCWMGGWALLGKKQWAGSVKTEGVNTGEPSQERKARSPSCSSEAVAGSAAMQESYDSELDGGLKDLAGRQRRGRDEGDSGRRNSRRRRWPRSCTRPSAMVVAAAMQ